MNKSETIKKYGYLCPIIIGVIFIIYGLCIQIPGGVLTTREYLNGNDATISVFDDTYSSIDEYVGEDSLNYIIGASLVAGKMSAAIISRSVFIVGGAICVCIGLALLLLKINRTPETDNKADVSTKTKSTSNEILETTEQTSGSEIQSENNEEQDVE